MGGKFYTTTYDKYLKKIKGIFWMPHVGRDYPQVKNKLLIIGSHYWPWPDEVPATGFSEMIEKSEKFERDMVSDYLNKHKEEKNIHETYKDWKNFNNAVSRLILTKQVNEHIEYTELEQAYCKIAKTNLIQNFKYVFKNNPPEEQKKDYQVMQRICDILQPTHILICGKYLWERRLQNLDYFKNLNTPPLWTYQPSNNQYGNLTRFYLRQLPEYHKIIKGWRL